MKKERKRSYSRIAKMIRRYMDDPWREIKIANNYKRKRRE